MTDQEIAQKFKAKCSELGFEYNANGTVLSVMKKFEKGNLDQFVECDMNGPYLLSLIKTTSPGSIWGTDGGSVGGHVAVTNGSYILNKSGCSKRLLKLLQ